jgi:hypothetical protein
MSANHWSKRPGFISPAKGRVFSEEQRKRMSEAHKGQAPWNKGTKGVVHISEEQKEQTRKRMIGNQYSRGRIQPEEERAKRRGRYPSAEVKKKLAASHAGPKNWNWKGGKALSNGYIRALHPEHPLADPNGRIYEHRGIVENIIGRHLHSRESVHHINKNKLDNRPGNLMAFTSERMHQLFEKGHAIDEANIIFDGRRW